MVKKVSDCVKSIIVYTVARHKLVVFVESDWREQPKRFPLSLGKGQRFTQIHDLAILVSPTGIGL